MAIYRECDGVVEVLGRWRTVAGSSMMLLLVALIGLYQMGVSVWVPWMPTSEQPVVPSGDKAKAASEAEAKLKLAEAEQQRQAKVEADANTKRRAAEGEQQRLKKKNSVRQKRKPMLTQNSTLRKLSNNGWPPSKRGNSGRQKQLMLKQSWKAMEAEQQRLKEEVQRQATAAANAEAQRRAAEAEQQRLREEVQRQTRVAADAEAKGRAAEAEQQRLAAVKADEERKAKAEAEAAARSAAPQPAPTVIGLFTIRSNTEAIGSPPVDGKPVSSIGECEQGCTQSATCKIFTFRKSTAMCYTYSDATFVPSDYFDTGIRK